MPFSMKCAVSLGVKRNTAEVFGDYGAGPQPHPAHRRLRPSLGRSLGL